MNRKYKYPLVIAINILLCPAVIPVSARQSASPTEGQQPVDSLSVYLEQAARNNPQVNADFMLYKASLEKIPRATPFCIATIMEPTTPPVTALGLNAALTTVTIAAGISVMLQMISVTLSTI